MSFSNLHRRKLATYTPEAWLLCVLLLVLCASTRLANYQIHQRVLKLATTQAYVDGTETLRKLPKAPPPLLWESTAIAFFATAAIFVARCEALLLVAIPFNGLDPERCLRPPPVL